MGTVGGGKSVVDVEIAQHRQGCGKGRIVVLFAAVKAQILQHGELAIGQPRDHGAGDIANTIRRERDRTAETLAQRG